jgi:hypothetical protein
MDDLSFTRIPFSAAHSPLLPEQALCAAMKESPEKSSASAHAMTLKQSVRGSRDAMSLSATPPREADDSAETPELNSSGDDRVAAVSDGANIIPPLSLYSSHLSLALLQSASHRAPARTACWSAPSKKLRPQSSQSASLIHPQSARPRQHTARLSARSAADRRPSTPLSAVPSRSQWKHDSTGWKIVRPETKR